MSATVVSSLGTEQDLRVHRGTDNTHTFTITGLKNSEDSAVLTVRESLAGPIVFSVTTSAGSHGDDDQTQFTVSRSQIDDEARADQIERWVYDVRWCDATGTKEYVKYYGAYEVWPSGSDPVA